MIEIIGMINNIGGDEVKFVGVCAICFNPVVEKNMVELRPGGRKFHDSCLDEFPNSYYVRLERRILKWKNHIKEGK